MLEEGGAEVENEIDTSPLLHHLGRGTKESSAQVGAWVPQRALEAVEPAAEVPSLVSNGLEFIFIIGDDLREFLLNEFGIRVLSTKPCETVCGLVQLPTLNKISG